MKKMSVKEALQNCHNVNRDICLQAFKVLNELNSESVPILLDELKSVDKQSGEIIVGTLMRIQREEGITHPEIVPTLTEFITTTLNPIAQGDAIGLLTDIYWATKDDSTYMNFLDMLKCKHEGVREGVADTLAELQDTRAVEPLIQLLHSNNLSVITSALDALEWFTDSRAVSHIIKLIETRKGIKSDSGLYMRIDLAEFAVGSLRKYETPEAMIAVIEWEAEQKNDKKADNDNT